jgi:hypothetical protein
LKSFTSNGNEKRSAKVNKIRVICIISGGDFLKYCDFDETHRLSPPISSQAVLALPILKEGGGYYFSP